MEIRTGVEAAVNSERRSGGAW